MNDGYRFNTNEFVPPPPPPKDDPRNDARLPIITGMSSLGLEIPLSPVSPSIIPSLAERSRKYSPLTDLIESEKAYVELLTGIIRKVAAAWSRSNLPPPELDSMFRSVEGVYKMNRILLAKLKEIGENPSSPKVLGDLLMRWIDDLEPPYMTYAERYCVGFDDWEPVKTNMKLPAVLLAFSASNPPSSALPQPTRLLDPYLWTLDALFLLPKGRLQYYKKLYSRLLKSTTPGRSDHKLLTGALGKLESLLATLDDRANTGIGNPRPPRALPPHINAEETPETVTPTELSTSESMERDALLSGHFGVDSPSVATSLRGSFSSRNERFSQEITLTSASWDSETLSSVVDLERRLATEKTFDLFTMQPKQIRLQITPPGLLYARVLRLEARALVRFTPKATGTEIIHRHGYIFILSDLFLLCEEMTREEKTARSEDGRDMYLCYPPLSGKVLAVNEVPGQDNALQISIMRKETLILESDSRFKRDRILDEFQECISFAKTISRAAQEPLPLMPPIDDSWARQRPDRSLNPRLIPQTQPDSVLSKHIDEDLSLGGTPPTSPRQSSDLSSPQHLERQNMIPVQTETIQDSRLDVVNNSAHSSGSLGNGQQLPILHDLGPAHPPRRSSSGYATKSPPSSFVPGQIVPPMRGASLQSSPSFAIAPLEPLEGPGTAYLPPIAKAPAPQNPALRHHASMHSLRQQPSLHSVTQGPHHQTFVPVPQPQSDSHLSNKESLAALSTNPSAKYHLTEQSLHKPQRSSSSRSLHAQYQYYQTPPPPVPSLPDGLSVPQQPYSQHKDSMGSLNTPSTRPLLPSVQMGSRTNSVAEPSILDPSPPTSPVEARKPLGPVRSVITSQMKCKVFQQQQHAQWKSLGSAHLTLYRQDPTNVKQLVVEAGSKEKSVLISTIVLTDGVERVGKTGVAVELSDAVGARSGVIYMIQLRNEDSASEFFRNLLAGSDRAS